MPKKTKRPCGCIVELNPDYDVRYFCAAAGKPSRCKYFREDQDMPETCYYEYMNYYRQWACANTRARFDALKRPEDYWYYY